MTTVDPSQLAVITAPADQWIRVEAGPGSGKTEVIARRVARLLDGDFAPAEVVVMTYTRAMAAELKRRIALHKPDAVPCRNCAGVQCDCGGGGRIFVGMDALNIGTMHSLASGWVRSMLEAHFDRERDFGRTIRAAGAAIVEMGWVTGPDFAFADEAMVQTMLGEVRRRLGKKNYRVLRQIAGLKLMGAALSARPVEAELRLMLRENGMVGLDDVLAMFAVGVEATRGGWGRLYPCLIVDEAQDMAAPQRAVVDAWRPRHALLVGDDGQSIMRFLGELAPPLPDGYVTMTLGANHRARPELVAYTNALRATIASAGACSPLAQAASRHGGGSVWEMEPVDEVTGIVDVVFDLVSRGVRAESIAILVATWDEVTHVVEALRRVGVDANIPLRRGGSWVGAPAARALITLMRACERGSITAIELAVLLRSTSLAAGIVSAAYEGGRSLANEMRERGTPVTGATHVAGALLLAHERGIGILEPDPDPALVPALNWMVQNPTAMVGDFLAWVDEDDFVASDTTDAVTVATIHAAKGREWPVVVLPHFVEGAMPPLWARVDEDVSEWGRAAYVAATRARDLLVVAAPMTYKGAQAQPSRWWR